MEVHERAQPAIFALAQKARQLTKHFDTQRRIGQPVLVVLMDSSTKWFSTFAMLEKHHRIRRPMLEVVVAHGHRFPPNTFYTDIEYTLMKDVIGILIH